MLTCTTYGWAGPESGGGVVCAHSVVVQPGEQFGLHRVCRLEGLRVPPLVAHTYPQLNLCSRSCFQSVRQDLVIWEHGWTKCSCRLTPGDREERQYLLQHCVMWWQPWGCADLLSASGWKSPPLAGEKCSLGAKWQEVSSLVVRLSQRWKESYILFNLLGTVWKIWK